MTVSMSISGLTYWQDLASALGTLHSRMMEEIHYIQDRSSNISEQKSKIDSEMNQSNGRVMFFQTKINNANTSVNANSDTQQNLELVSIWTNLMEKELERQQQFPMEKMILDVESNMLDKEERRLVAQKENIDVRRRFALEVAKTTEKRIDQGLEMLS